MGPPTTVCKICKQTVLKAQTCHVGNGERACKKHEGVEQEKERLALRERQPKEAQELKKKQEQERQRKEAEEFLDPRPRCWVCGNTGITSQAFYYNLLMYGKKQELKGNILNPFAPEYAKHVRAAQGLKEGEKISVVFILPIAKDHPVIKNLERSKAQAAQFAGAISICAECSEKYKVERPMPKISLEQLCVLGAIMEPVVREEAERN